MKKLRFLMIALVAVLGLSSCEKDNNNHDHSADFVGTWTCLTPNLAEALVINADGSFVSTGLVDGNYWEDIAGKIVVEDGNVTLDFENGNNIKGHFDIIPGVAFSIYNEEGGRFTFNYCKEDLSEEIVGMWVCNETPSAEENDMIIMTYKADGTTLFTGYAYEVDFFGANMEASYKVVGDLLIHKQPDLVLEYGLVQYSAIKLIYTPNATSLGDVMSLKAYARVGENLIETTTPWLRIKQHLELPGNSYSYSNIYVTNVKGQDKEFEFAGQTLNFSTLDGSVMDKMMKNILFNVSFPSANEIVYNCYYNGESVSMPSPIVVDGNKMTIKKSAKNSIYKDIDVWTFQDQDNTQMHMYMPAYSFENFIANTAVELMSQNGELDLDDTEAVAAIYNGVANAIETINVSFVLKARK